MQYTINITWADYSEGLMAKQIDLQISLNWGKQEIAQFSGIYNFLHMVNRFFNYLFSAEKKMSKWSNQRWKH